MKSGRRLLMLAYYFPPQNTSGASRPSRFAKYLEQLGYSLRVISLATDDPGDIPDRVHAVPQKNGRSSFTSAASQAAYLVERAVLPYNDRLPWVPHAIAKAANSTGAGHITVVFSTSPPLATHLAALRLKKRFGVKWIADLRDPLCGNPFRTRKIGNAYDGILQRLIFENADALIANTDVVAETWRKQYPQWRDKISVIWNGFDPDESLPVPTHRSRARRIILHAGNLYRGRKPDLLLNSLARLIDASQVDPASFRVDLVGALEADALLPFSNLVEKGCLHYNGVTVPRLEASNLMADADFLLLIDINEANVGVQLPAKIFDYIRVGRPILVITTRNSPAERILADSGVPHVCLFPDESPLLADAKVQEFLKLSSDPVVASPWFWNEFDARSQAQTLSAVIDQLEETSVIAQTALPDPVVSRGK